MTVLRSYVGGAWTEPADEGRPVLDAVTGEDQATIVDPVTRERFGYRLLDRAEGEYELCAVFEAADSTGGRGGSIYAPSFWNHGVGRHCFEIAAGTAWKRGRIPER